MRSHHLIFYINQVKPYRIEKGDPNIVAPSIEPMMIANRRNIEVEKILAYKTTQFGKNPK